MWPGQGANSGIAPQSSDCRVADMAFNSGISFNSFSDKHAGLLWPRLLSPAIHISSAIVQAVRHQIGQGCLRKRLSFRPP
jgi:hypothetical protein